MHQVARVLLVVTGALLAALPLASCSMLDALTRDACPEAGVVTTEELSVTCPAGWTYRTEGDAAVSVKSDRVLVIVTVAPETSGCAASSEEGLADLVKRTGFGGKPGASESFAVLGDDVDFAVHELDIDSGVRIAYHETCVDNVRMPGIKGTLSISPQAPTKTYEERREEIAKVVAGVALNDKMWREPAAAAPAVPAPDDAASAAAAPAEEAPSAAADD